MAKSFRLRKKLAKKQGKPVPKKGAVQPTKSARRLQIEAIEASLAKQKAELGIKYPEKYEKMLEEMDKMVEENNAKIKALRKSGNFAAADQLAQDASKKMDKFIEKKAGIKLGAGIYVANKLEEIAEKRKEEFEAIKNPERAKKEALKLEEEFLIDEFKYKSYKRKEYLTNMLTERAEDVPKDLLDAVKEAIYEASDDELDELEYHMTTEYDEDFWKDFYLANNPNLRGRNERQERIDILNEVLEFLRGR